MIQELSITNTLSIKTKQTISFEASKNTKEDAVHYIDIGSTRLLKLAAIYGSNASGKTNFLKAVNFYFRFMLYAFSDLKPKEGISFIPFLFDSKTLQAPGVFDIVFFYDSIKYEYHLSLDAKCVHTESLYYSPKGQKKLIYNRTLKSNTTSSSSPLYNWKFGDTLSGNKTEISKMTRPNTTFLNTAAQLEQPELGAVYDALASNIMPIITSTTKGLMGYTIKLLENNAIYKKDILSLLEKADFGKIKDIIVEEREVPIAFWEKLTTETKKDLSSINKKSTIKEVFISHKYDSDYNLPLSNESAGTQRMLELAGPILKVIKNNYFICIDEIEASLHQELLEFLFVTFLENSKESQILFTTHNLDLLESELLLDDGIWFCEKEEDGGSVYTSLVEYKGIRKEASRKKLYNAGRFGAKPIISTFIVD
ncbi:MAG TPA: ATP-binding protein [Treponemataceae bacterium]|nr:ATP-binding protein [Treponemataceae bacterium]